MPESMFTLAPIVARALDAGEPTVALETTLVSHGFPRGRGADVAIESETAIRSAGATPVTVGVVEGRIRVGLDIDEIRMLSEHPDARKVGARDLASCLVRRELGATTVGGTLAICRAVGIRVFATGGLGGVHRGYETRLDVSSDLGELARSETIVVCSGVKSLLDVSATLEALESLSVPVLGWRTERLPLFYSASGGPPIERIDAVEELASIARAHWKLGGKGLIIARAPVPEIDAAEMAELFDAALAAASEAGVVGGGITPFVLAHAHESSGGRSLDVNHRLIVDNAALAADVANALDRIPT